MSETKEQSQQLTLNYAVIEKVANRSYLRDNFKRGNRETYHIPEEMIQEREGFNNRLVYENMDEMKVSLIANGLLDPLVVDVLPDGTVYVDEGYRRIRGIRLAKADRPDLFSTVECFVNGADTTELQRKIRVSTSNQCREILKPIERANNAYEIKYCFGKEKSNDEVGNLLGGVSRQTVDNLIKIASAPDDLKNEMLMADMSITECVKFLANHKKMQKKADEKEDASHETSASAASLPQDPLKKDLEGLSELDKQAEEMKEQNQEENAEARANRERVEREQLLEVANEVYVSDVELAKHIGKRLAAPAVKSWEQDFVDEATSEVVSIQRNEVVLEKGALVDEDTIKTLIEEGVKVCFINKEVTVAPSVITEPVAEKEKNKYDSDRPEIAQVQNSIQLNDRLSVRVEKLDISEGDKKDLLSWLQWQMKDLIGLRDWVHTNKKQNFT